MYFETYNGERYFALFGAISTCEDISLAPQSATSSTASLKKNFPDHQKCYFKETFQNKMII